MMDSIILAALNSATLSSHPRWPFFMVPVEPIALAGDRDESGDTRLIELEWDRSSVTWSACTVGEQRVVIESQQSTEEGPPRILATGAGASASVLDRLFLQALFSTNGAAFGTGVAGSPPRTVLTTLDSWDFIVDLFWSLFDAMEDSWSDLLDFELDDGLIWNDEYENPRKLPRALERSIREDAIRGARSSAQGFARSIQARALIDEARRQVSDGDRGVPFMNAIRGPRLREDEREQMVARYLGQVLEY